EVCHAPALTVNEGVTALTPARVWYPSRELDGADPSPHAHGGPHQPPGDVAVREPAPPRRSLPPGDRLLLPPARKPSRDASRLLGLRAAEGRGPHHHRPRLHEDRSRVGVEGDRDRPPAGGRQLAQSPLRLRPRGRDPARAPDAGRTRGGEPVRGGADRR